MAAEQVCLRGANRQQDVVPPARRTHGDDLEVGLLRLHRGDKRIVAQGITLDGHVTQLPIAEHFVADAPPGDLVRLWVPVARALRAPAAVAGAGRVFHLVGGIPRAAEPGVHRNVGFGANLGAKAHELIQPEIVVLDRVPGAFPARRTLVALANAVFPVVAGHEVAAGPACDR